MKALSNFWFTPRHQPAEGEKVEFELRPLDQRTFLYLQGEMVFVGDNSKISVDGITRAYQFSVVGWRGLNEEFTSASKAEKLNGTADFSWGMWQMEIAAALYRRVVLGEDEAKNS